MKKTMNPVWYLVIGITLLIVPTAIYLGFLIPKMTAEYNVLMASGGAIGSAGLFGANMIPETAKFGTLYKTASKSMTLLVVITLVQNFIGRLIGLAVVVVVSYILFLIFKGLWKDGRQRKQNADIAKEIARGITQTAK